MQRIIICGALVLTVLLGAAGPGRADESDAELAKKTQNPIADLISLPLQYNQDYGIGPADAQRRWVNVQPVIPASLNAEWNLISRIIVPFIDAESPIPGGAEKVGMGDINPSFFFTPKKEIAGWLIGAGPVLLFPTATQNELGAEKFGAGPTAVLLRQEHGFTVGILANHIWSYAGNGNRPEVNSSFLQPFLSYTAKTHTTLSVNTESTYDWRTSQWTVPVNVMLSQILRLGGQPLSLQAGYRYYAETPAGGPDWGWRFNLTFLFPK